MGQACGWAGKILRVDLSAGRIDVQDSMELASPYLGGRGFAARIAWDEIPRGTGPNDPANRLMVMPGSLTGTTAPYSGRSGVYAVSPQAYPIPWFSRSSLGGHWGAEFKYAGYDGIVVYGKASEPVYLSITDDKVEIRSARHLWGQGLYATQQKLMDELGQQTRIVAIGPAGENQSRIAVVATETESAAGQGGYGALMGAKKLKAIAVRGSGAIHIAHGTFPLPAPATIELLKGRLQWFGGTVPDVRYVALRYAVQGDRPGGRALRPARWRRWRTPATSTPVRSEICAADKPTSR